MAEGTAGDGDSSHNPRNLRDLLRFCTEMTKKEDAPQESDVQELTGERRAFLEAVFNGLQGDNVKFLAECLAKLTGSAVDMAGEDVTEQENALDTLSEYIEDINYAIDVYNMNGFPILVNCLKSPHPSIQIRVAEVIGSICQNNEFCQRKILPYDVIPLLLTMLDTHIDPDCRVKALYALSCVVREYEPAEQVFVKSLGLSFLMRAIQTYNSKLIMKSAFLLNHFIEKDEKCKDSLIAMGFVEQFIIVLFNDQIGDDSREYCLRSLLKLCSSSKTAISESLRPEFSFVQRLKHRQQNISGKEEYSDYRYLEMENRFNTPACKVDLKDLAFITCQDGKWIYNDNKIKFDIKLLWLQGLISDVSTNKDEIQLSQDNCNAIIINCQNIPGGNQWLGVGQYVQVIGELKDKTSTWDATQVKAFKITNLTSSSIHKMMWPYEVQEAKNLYKNMGWYKQYLQNI